MTFDIFSTEKQRLGIKTILEQSTRRLQRDTGAIIHCAIFENKGDLVEAIGPNPVHFACLDAVIKAARIYLTPKMGETLITNDPYSGNSRLCDLVLIQGAFGRQQANELRYYVVVQISLPQLLNRSTEKLFSSIEDEGFRIPPTPLDRDGKINAEILGYLAQSKIDQNVLSSLLEKVRSALKTMGQDLITLETKYSRDTFTKGLEALKLYSEKMMRRALHEIPDGDYGAIEVMESDGFGTKNLRIQCRLSVAGENILLSFLGSAKQTKGPYNCNYAITLGACFWVFRSLLKRDIPINSGAFKAFSVEAPDGTIVNAGYPAPLLGGYYETSKRISDALFVLLNKALPSEVPAQNGGSSSICLIKVNDLVFAEVLGSGGGATKHEKGSNVTFTELHNSPATSLEEIENNFPIHLTQSNERNGSGGDGKFVGGCGLTRSYKFLAPAQVMLLSDKRIQKPRGLFGGTAGQSGEITLVQKNSKKIIEEKTVLSLLPGDEIIIQSPGGGGWGKKEEPELIQE
jgi:N-methylhydantoinase B